MDCEDMYVPVTVVLPAAGSGKRMTGSQPKQYMEILGRPLISYTIESFERYSWVTHIVVVSSKNKHGDMLDLVQKYNHDKVTVTIGHDSRHKSIREGVKTIGLVCADPGVVIIHDAARPFIEENNIKQIVLAAKQHGAAGVTRPLTSTVLSVSDEGFLDHALERSKYFASEMPQAFRFDIIMKAYNECTNDDLNYGTECLHLAQKYSNVTPKLTAGPNCLWKVTFRKDIYAAEGMIKESADDVLFVSAATTKGSPSLLYSHLAHSLQLKNLKVRFTSKDLYSQSLYGPNDPAEFKSRVFYHSDWTNVDDINLQISQSLERDHQFSPKYNSVLIVVIDLTMKNHKNMPQRLDTLQEYILKKGKNSPVCNISINAIICKSNTEEDIKRSASLLADIVFNRNLLYSGQTFVT